ncbi:MAG: GNAT family N-acetyltransferase [Thermomicrobiales bacterium]
MLQLTRERNVRRAAETTFRVEIERGGLPLLEQLAGEWRELCAEGPCAEPFLQPEWVIANLRLADPHPRLVVLTARSGGRLRALLPLREDAFMLGMVCVRRLRAPVTIHSNRFDLIHGPGEQTEAMAALWDAIERWGGCDVIDVTPVADGGALFEFSRHAARSGGFVGLRDVATTPYITLGDEAGRVDPWRETTAKFRANLRRRRRNLEERGPLVFTRTDRADRGMLDAFYALERAGWKGRAGTAIVDEPGATAFFDEIAAGAERNGYLALSKLESGGDLVAFHFGLEMAGRYSVPKLAFNEKFHAFAPGHLMIDEVLRDCTEREVREFDFLDHSAPWKLEWTSTLRRHSRIVIYRRGIKGRMLHEGRFHVAPAVNRVRKRLIAVGASGMTGHEGTR